MKQRFNVYSRQRRWELASWAVELDIGILRLFLGECVAAVIVKA